MINIRIDKYTIQQCVLLAGVLVIVYLVWFGVNTAIKKSSTQTSCERNCKTFKSSMLGGQCFCATSAGWTPVGRAALVDKMVKGK